MFHFHLMPTVLSSCLPSWRHLAIHRRREKNAAHAHQRRSHPHPPPSVTRSGAAAEPGARKRKQHRRPHCLRASSATSSTQSPGGRTQEVRSDCSAVSAAAHRPSSETCRWEVTSETPSENSNWSFSGSRAVRDGFYSSTEVRVARTWTRCTCSTAAPSVTWSELTWASFLLAPVFVVRQREEMYN